MFEYREYDDGAFVIGFVKEDKSWECLFFCFSKHNAAKLAEILNEEAALAKPPRRYKQKQS